MFFYRSSKEYSLLTSISPCCYNHILISDTNKLSLKGLRPMKRKTHKHQMLLLLMVMIIIIALKTPVVFHICTLSNLYPNTDFVMSFSCPISKSDHSR